MKLLPHESPGRKICLDGLFVGAYFIGSSFSDVDMIVNILLTKFRCMV